MRQRAGSVWFRRQASLSRAGTMRLAAVSLLGVVAGIVQAWCIALLVGPLLAGDPVTRPALWAFVFVLAALLRAGLVVLGDGVAVEAGATARRRLRTEFLVSAFAAGPHGTAATGPAVVAAIDHVDALDGYFGRWLPAALVAWAGPLLVLAAAAAVDPVAALVLLAGGAAVPFGMAVAGLGAAAASQRQFAAMSRLQTRFLDRVRGIATIVLAGQAEAEAGRLRIAATELSNRTMRVLRVAFLSSAVLDAAAAAVLIVLAIRAGLALRAGTLWGAGAVFTLVLVTEFFAPLRAFSAAYQDSLRANVAAKMLAGPETAAAAPADRRSIRTVAANGVTIAFDQVRFTWDPARGPALDGLSFRVPAGETVVLVGPSGAGKSTIIELLLGFVQPDSGRITVNGADLSSITASALSRMTAWIGQQPVLFAASIRDNIRFGREGASDDDIAAAAAAAGLGPVAAGLPEGLDTLVGEGGYGLSGGQAQRVAIARAILRNAPLLLLDEPTAHLDPATEADVLDSLRRLAIGRTVILASHSSAARAFGGRRIMLEHGRATTVQGAA